MLKVLSVSFLLFIVTWKEVHPSLIEYYPNLNEDLQDEPIEQSQQPDDSFNEQDNVIEPQNVDVIQDWESDEGVESERQDEPYLLKTLTQTPSSASSQQRNARQRTCKWTGCHKLPLGKDSSCPNGTYLESYKVCEPRGNKNIDAQCCPV